ncbi:MAG: fused MFS/spermidine synthase [Candidatus Latescibacteria bacterium]|nr:fused MFS/spermidine synthase [Candidatus Latescibacterota bacterium]
MSSEDKGEAISGGTRVVVLVIFFASGVAGLTYEIIWSRMLTLILGTTVMAVATVLSAFMAGLALGSFLFGRYVDRSTRPLTIYALLELGIGGTALLLPSGFAGIGWLYGHTYTWFGGSVWWHSLLRFFLSAAALLLPCTLMGGTLPVLSKFLVNRISTVGSRIGDLYSINTAGAIVGCGMTGFLLLGTLGTRLTTELAAAINLVVALSALALQAKYGRPSLSLTLHAEEQRGKGAGEILLRSPAPPLPRRGGEGLEGRVPLVVYVALGLSGFVALSLEVLWARALLFFLGHTPYAFTVILVTFLIGIAAGSYVIGKLSDKVRDPLYLLGIVELAAGIGVLISIPAMAHLFEFINALTGELDTQSWLGTVATKFAGASVVMFVPALFFGAAFPVGVKIVSTHVGRLGRSVGSLYAVNTLGAIFGSVFAGFLLIPLFGIGTGISLVAGISLAVALLVFLCSTMEFRKVWATVCAILILFGVGGGILTSKPVILYTEAFDPPKGRSPRYTLLYSKEGIDCSLAVLLDNADGIRELSINGTSTAFTDYQDMQVHRLLGHLPMIVHQEPKKVLIIGLGFGSTAWAAMQYNPERVDCVELVREEVETADLFRDINYGILRHPKFRMILEDVRSYILGTDERYDVLSFNAVHPRLSPNLYTRDFYRLCSEKLNPGGIICAWMPTNWMTDTEYRMLLRTFQSVFPYTSLWWSNPAHTILLGSTMPIALDFKRIESALARPGVKEDLAHANLDNPYTLLNEYLMGTDRIAAYVADAPLNTDDLPKIEYSKETRIKPDPEMLEHLLSYRERLPIDIGDLGKEASTMKGQLDASFEAQGHFLRGHIDSWFWKMEEARAELTRAVELAPHNENFRKILTITGEKIREQAKVKAYRANSFLRKGNYEAAIEQLRLAVTLDPAWALGHQLLGEAYFSAGKLDSAHTAFSTAIELDSTLVAARMNLGNVYRLKGIPDQAIGEYVKALEMGGPHTGVYYNLGVTYELMGKRKLALESFERALQVDPAAPAPVREAVRRLREQGAGSNNE